MDLLQHLLILFIDFLQLLIQQFGIQLVLFSQLLVSLCQHVLFLLVLLLEWGLLSNVVVLFLILLRGLLGGGLLGLVLRIALKEGLSVPGALLNLFVWFAGLRHHAFVLPVFRHVGEVVALHECLIWIMIA